MPMIQYRERGGVGRRINFLAMINNKISVVII